MSTSAAKTSSKKQLRGKDLLKSKVSLLQKYQSFSRANPEELEAKSLKENKKKYFDLSLPIDVAQKINEIHTAVALEEKEKQRKEKIQQDMPPRLNMHLKYHFPGQRSVEDLCDDDDVDIFDIDDTNALSALVRDGDPNKKKSRLEIIVEDAYNIDVWLQPREKILEAAVKCVVVPDSSKRGPKLKTDYERTSFDYTRWDHKFVFQGFSIEQLMSRSFEFTLKIVTNNGKRDMGYCRLNPRQCEMAALKDEEKEFCTFDQEFWGKFLQNPSVPLEVLVPLLQKESVVAATVDNSSVFSGFKSLF